MKTRSDAKERGARLTQFGGRVKEPGVLGERITVGHPGNEIGDVAGAGADLAAAIESLKPERIVGAEVATRDDAMTAGEMGADYVMFGAPRPGERPAPLDALIERVAWWAEIFETPCVAYAGALAGIPELARAGADFVAIGDALFEDPRGLTAAAADAAARLTVTETTT